MGAKECGQVRTVPWYAIGDWRDIVFNEAEKSIIKNDGDSLVFYDGGASEQTVGGEC